jgi:autotransporter-associated beta strand protein
MKLKYSLRHFLTLAGSSLLAFSSASAATLQWDHNADGTPSDGANRWASPTYPNRWWNGTASVSWANNSVTRDDAVFGFGGAGGTLSLAADSQPNPIYVGNITFNNFTGTYAFYQGGLNFDGTFTVNNASTGRVHFDNTAMSGSGSIVLDKGILSLRSGGNYTGTTTANGGTLWLWEKGGMSTGSNFTVNNGVNLIVDVASAQFNTGLSGAGSLGGLFAGTTSGNKTITYNGTINLNLNLRAADSGDFAGSIASLAGGGTVGNLSISSGTATNALTLSGANSYTGTTTIDKAVLKLGNGGTTGSLTGTSSITMANSANLTINRSNPFTQATDLNGKAITGTGSFTQAGSGTTTLSLVNTYNGTTTVNAGTLEVSSTGSIANTSSITINTGGELKYGNNAGLDRNVTLSGGTFRYNASTAYSGTLTYNSGTLAGTNLNGTAFNNQVIGTNKSIAPGNSPGTMSVADQTWAAGGTYLWELSNATGTAGNTNGWDLLSGTGTLNITASLGSEFIIDLTTLASLSPDVLGDATNFDSGLSYSWLIADFATVTGFDATDFTIDFTGFDNAYTGTFGLSWTDGATDKIFLNYTAVPEPRAALLGGLGMLVLLRRRRIKIG